MVEVKDLQSGDVTAVARRPGRAMSLKLARPVSAPGSTKTARTIAYSGGWDVGRIYETRGGPDSLHWFWSLTVNGLMTRSDRVPSLEEAEVQLQKSWDAWKASVCRQKSVT
jgi:hypothetical protein